MNPQKVYLNFTFHLENDSFEMTVLRADEGLIVEQTYNNTYILPVGGIDKSGHFTIASEAMDPLNHSSVMNFIINDIKISRKDAEILITHALLDQLHTRRPKNVYIQGSNPKNAKILCADAHMLISYAHENTYTAFIGKIEEEGKFVFDRDAMNSTISHSSINGLMSSFKLSLKDAEILIAHALLDQLHFGM